MKSNGRFEVIQLSAQVLAAAVGQLPIEGCLVVLLIVSLTIVLIEFQSRERYHLNRIDRLEAELAKSEASLKSERNQPSAGAMRVLRAYHGVSGAMKPKEISEKISWNVGAVEYGLEELNSLNMVQEVEPGRFAATMVGGGLAAWDYNNSEEGRREHAEYLKTLPR